MKDTVISFADVVHQTISFKRGVPSQKVVLDICDTRWFQRLRDISQTANTRLVYMFSEHSRFGHCLGAAYLAVSVLEQLKARFPREVEPYELVVSAAAALHDLGHLAPGSHTAFKVWFPELGDAHEELTCRIVRESSELRELLSSYHPDLPEQVSQILLEQASFPPWVTELISGSGWNIDRGNWCVVDSVMAGVTYGKYNIPALTDALAITPQGHLAVSENRLDALMHFVISRHALYRQVYQHRVLLATDRMMQAIVRRARDLGSDLEFADHTMREALAAKTVDDLSLDTVFEMRESWWRYHLSRWMKSGDRVLSDLADRLLHRRLLKTVRVQGDQDHADLLAAAAKAVQEAGYDPRYYLHELSTANVHSGEGRQQMAVLRADGRVVPVADADPLVNSLYEKAAYDSRGWLALPAEAKRLLKNS